MKRPEPSARAAFKATVAICTFNGADRLHLVLKGLAAQTLSPHSWEVLIVDNASTDDTGKRARQLEASLLPGRLRVVREESPGLSFARWRAAREARGEIICFLDDDNVPAPDFVAHAVASFAARPQAGAIGGKVVPVWESAPTPLAVTVQNFALAICDYGNQPFRYETNTGPVGAGLCIRSELLRKIYQTEESVTTTVGRSGKDTGSGDDLAIAIQVWKHGFECWYEPSMVLEHHLPDRRMRKDYLLKLYEGIGRGQASARRFHDWKANNPALATAIGMKDLVRWLKGKVAGPRADLVTQPPDLARDLHDLHQRQLWGRALQALKWKS